MRRDDGPPGITPLDHTADVGLDVRAADAPELFVRAGLGLVWLIHGDRAPSRSAERRAVEVSAADLAALLRSWLRELLHLHEAEGLSFCGAHFDVLEDTHLRAEVCVAPPTREPLREIKGVTLHGLIVEQREEGWVGRVVFDV